MLDIRDEHTPIGSRLDPIAQWTISRARRACRVRGSTLHYRTKEELFKAAVLAQTESLRAACKVALAREDQSVEERIVGAFEATHGSLVGRLGSEYMGERMETAVTLVGESVHELDRELVADVVRLLKSSGLADAWKTLGVSAKELGENLLATSLGVKRQVESSVAHRDKLRIAVRMVCSRHTKWLHSMSHSWPRS